MPVPITENGASVDISPRFPVTTTVAGSPAAASETVIATLTIPNFANIPVVTGVLLQGWAAYTVGTSGTAVTLQIKQTNTSGSAVASTGALTRAATNLAADDVNGFDSGAGVSVYVLTMTVANGAAASTVSKVFFGAVLL
jgi:hypothetical protein